MEPMGAWLNQPLGYISRLPAQEMCDLLLKYNCLCDKGVHVDINGSHDCVYLSLAQGIDYVGQSANLAFTRGDSQNCHTVDIIQDDVCEYPDPEYIFVNLAYVSGIQSINIVQDRTQVLIDSGEPTCGTSTACRLHSISWRHSFHSIQLQLYNIT